MHTKLHIRTQQSPLSPFNPIGDVNKHSLSSDLTVDVMLSPVLTGCVTVELGSPAHHQLKMKVLSSENQYFPQRTQIFEFRCSFRAGNSEEMEAQLHKRGRLVLNN